MFDNSLPLAIKIENKIKLFNNSRSLDVKNKIDRKYSSKQNTFRTHGWLAKMVRSTYNSVVKFEAMLKVNVLLINKQNFKY